MTLRLTGLMSLVLALCLATFALMTRRYHDEVMQELPRTVAQAGREALRSLEPGAFEFRVGKPAFAVAPPAIDRQRIRELEERSRQVRELARESEHLRALVERAGVREALHEGLRVVVEGRTVEDLALTELRCEGEDCIAWQSSEGGFPETQFVRIDAIHAETDPATGVLLRIPTVRTRFIAEGGPGAVEPPAGAFEVRVEQETVRRLADEARAVAERAQALGVPASSPSAVVPDSDPAVPTAPLVVDQDILLPIRTDDYQALYDRFRTKSMLLLAGVFGVGLALTTGLATRFTRPVRRLDAALREISDGNLDVAVPTHGSDEIARLGRAFNEMTGKLREGRDRARELTRREKLTALGRLAAGVAHDVRNPLHSISLTLEHLHESKRPREASEAEDFDRSIAIIREEIRRLDGLVGSFLRFAASGGRERTRVRLGAMVEEVARLVRKEAEWRGVRVDSRISDDDPEIDADVESVRASLLNLVLNAFEAMPEGGDLVLAARREGDEAILEVRDTGVGIPDADRERVFEFAYSTKDGGSGLGLAIVHQCVVEDHGGRVTLVSRVGEGTTMTLRFPTDAPDGAAS